MGIEAFAEAAAASAPGFHVTAIEDMRFEAAFKLFRDEPRTARVHALAVRRGDALLAECKLIGSRVLPGRAEAQDTVHFSGRVELQRSPLAPREGALPDLSRPADMTAEEIYRFYFHGPAYRVLEAVWVDGDRAVGRMASSLPPNHTPEGAPTLAMPRLIELCFQTAGIWEQRATGRLALPRGIDRVELLTHVDDGASVLAVTRAVGDAFDAEVIDDRGRVVLSLRGYRTVALPAGAGMNEAR